MCGALPVALTVRNHALMTTLSTASVGFVTIFAAVILLFAFLPAVGAVAGAAAPVLAPVALWQPEGLLLAFPVMSYSFTAHPYYLGIYNALQSRDAKRMGRVTDAVCARVANVASQQPVA